MLRAWTARARAARQLAASVAGPTPAAAGRSALRRGAVAAEAAGPASIASARAAASLALATPPASIVAQRGGREFSTGIEITGDIQDEGRFHEIADDFLDDVVEKIEIWAEQLDVDSDVECSQGVLTVALGDRGTFVINKQTPNRQIWLSSPISGPFRYDHLEGGWKSTRDGHELRSKLEDELSQLGGKSISL